MAALVRRGLSEEGAAVDVARTGEDALWMAAAAPYDALVLDVMLPGIDGFETCRRLRADGVWAPVLMLTARDAVEDRVARPRRRRRRLPDQAVLVRRAARRGCGRSSRRGPQERPAVLEVGDLRLDPATRQVWRGERGDRAVGQGVRAARGLHAPPGRGAVAGSSCSSTPGTSTTRTAPTSSTCTCATCARRSTARSASASDRDGARRGLPAARGRRRHREPAARCASGSRSPSRP